MRLLLLGGTTEASALARALAGEVAVTLSLAGRTSNPVLPPVAIRSGGFGGAEGLARYLIEHRFAALLDATHPFAVRITANAVLAARLANVLLLVLLRPEWLPGPADRWTMVADMPAAAAALGAMPRRVLLTIGQQDLAPFAAAAHDYVVRSVEAPDPATLPPQAEVIAARGPFALADELALLRRYRINAIVTKNSGGAATYPKLEAARALRLPVIMIARPPPPDAPSVPDVAQALRWVHDTAAMLRGV